jgi:flagellar biosynthesis/type III secretory pathway protein FliH
MSLSDRKGDALWRPAPASVSGTSRRQFVTTGLSSESSRIFVGNSDSLPGSAPLPPSDLEIPADELALEPVSPLELVSAQEESGAAAEASSRVDPDHQSGTAAAGPALDLEALRQDAFQQGFREGQALLQEELAREHNEALALLQSMIEAMRNRLGDAQGLHASLRRLALHIAEVLVRGELQISGQVIDRLLGHCIDTLAEPADVIVLRLNPGDADRLRAMGEQVTAGLQIECDPKLLPGSVRLQSGETLVEDLMETRLEAVASRLLDDPQAWRLNSPLLNPRQAESAFNAGAGQPRWAGRVVDTVDAEPVVQERAIGRDDA